jgi:FAD/FMN-containing dehydrogenase
VAAARSATLGRWCTTTTAKERPIVLRATTTLEDLRERLTGRLVLPGDPDWDAARAAWLLDVDQRPAAVTQPATAADVAAVVSAARGLGLRVAPQTTGHHASALAPLKDTILLKTSGLTGVEVDAATRTARAASGAVWLDVSRPASAAGLAGLAGSSPDVGVAGYTLGGGLGWLARRHGLAANSVTAIELVTAEGRPRRVDHRHDPELFWALRGGGGRFGAVTALEFRLYPVPELYAGWLAWPWERAREVLQAWREWLPSLPDEVTSIGRLLQVPPLPEIPATFRGRQLVAVEAAMLCDRDAGAGLLRPLRAMRPEIDTFAAVPPLALSHLNMDPEGPVPAAVGGHRLLADLPAEGVDALAEVAGAGSGSPLQSIELRQLGGAVARAAPGAGALATLDAAFMLFGGGMPDGPDAAAAMEARLHTMFERLEPWDSGRLYANFAKDPADPRAFFPPEVYRRLQRVKAEVDPDELFLPIHPIPAGAG